MVKPVGSGQGGAKGPGWFAHSPLMACLSASLRRARGLPLSRALTTFLSPAVGLARKILARLSGREPLHPLWRGGLHLERRVTAVQRGQPVFRRLVERQTRGGGKRRAFQPLSLPQGTLEEPLDWPVPVEEMPGDFVYPLAAEGEAGGETLSETDALPAQARQPAERGGYVRTGMLADNQNRAALKLGDARPAAWPFTLVSRAREERAGETPLTQPHAAPGQPRGVVARAVAGGQAKVGHTAAEHTQPGIGLTPGPARYSAPAPAGGQARARMAVRQAVSSAPDETTQPRLQARGMTVLAASMPLTAVPWEQTERSGGDVHGASGETASGREEVSWEAGGGAPSGPAGTRGMMILRRAEVMLNLGGTPGTAGPGTRPRRTAAPASAAAESLWPLVGVMRQVEAGPAQPGEPAALQHLRLMWPEISAEPGESLASLTAALGAGEPLPAPLRREFETHLGRELGEVRLHASPLAQKLRAEAFTSGRQIVFAPGKFQPNEPAGLALLGHELSHLGQPLAFKAEGGLGAPADDQPEQEARRQEERILRITSQGWPNHPERTTQHAVARPGSQPAVQRSIQVNEVQSEVTQPPADGAGGQAQAQGQGGEGHAPAQQAATAGGSRAGGAQSAAPATDLSALARQVYSILKDRLRAERSRHELYGR